MSEPKEEYNSGMSETIIGEALIESALAASREGEFIKSIADEVYIITEGVKQGLERAGFEMP